MALLGTAIWLSAANNSNAQNATQIREFTNIHPQALASALRELGKERGLQIVYRSELVGELRTAGAAGELTADEAMDQLLKGTGLAYHYLDDKTITVVAVRDEQDRPAPSQRISARPNFLSRFIALLGGSAVVSTAVVPAHAQTADSNQLEEIIVTAERREAGVQNTAASLTVRSGDNLLEQGKYTLSNILEDIPGVDMLHSSVPVGGAGSDIAGSSVTIRGIESNSGVPGATTSVAPATAVYVDGVYEGVGGDYDIERVEVLRGPQGTLYGRSATAGVIATHTRNPELDKFGGNVSLKVGSYELRHYDGAINIPVGSQFAVRIAGNQYERNGTVVDTGDGRTETTGGKVKFLYEPSEDLSVLVGVALQNTKNYTGGVAVNDCSTDESAPNFCNKGDITYNFDVPVGEGTNKYRQYWAEINWNLGFGTLTYQPALRTWYSNQLTINALPVIGPFTLSSYTPDDNFRTQELRLASNADSPFTWQVGALYYDNDLTNTYSGVFNVSNALANGWSIAKNTKALGGFAEATIPFAEQWRVTAGLRYDDTKVQVDQTYYNNRNAGITGIPGTPSWAQPVVIDTYVLSGDAGKLHFNKVTYKLRLEHDLSPANMAYASISTGYSPGDVSVTLCSTPAGTSACALYLEAETLTAYEIGSKNRFLENSLQVNVALYYNDFGAHQTQNINIGTFFNPVFTTLAVPVKAYGGELEIDYQLTPVDLLGLNVGYVHARYVDKPAPFAQAVANDEVTGAGSPVRANLSYSHIFVFPGDSSLTLRGAVRYQSAWTSVVTDTQQSNGAEELARSGAQTVGDLNATWSSPAKRFSLTGYVRNVTNKKYATVSSIVTDDAPWLFTQSRNEERNWGLGARMRF